LSREAIDTRTRSIRRGSGHGTSEDGQRKLCREAKAEPALRSYREDIPRHGYALARANAGAQALPALEASGLDRLLAGLREDGIE
jgi:hypothetical protein